MVSLCNCSFNQYRSTSHETHKLSSTPRLLTLDHQATTKNTASTATTLLSPHSIKTKEDTHANVFSSTLPVKKNPSNAYTKNDFSILKPLAKGQYGKVYIVQCLLDQQIYCMKIQSRRSLMEHGDRVNFENERNILAYQDPRLIGLFASFRDGDDFVLVMEYACGGDLFSLLDRQPTLCLTEHQAQFYMAEMVLACQSLHQLNYLHRDIKPQNILLDRNGHVKLADFGSSRSLSQCMETIQSTPVGTCDYISPEILLSNQGNVTYGTEVDCWSLGICLYEMLQELPPFYSDKGENDTYRKILFHQGSVSFNPRLPISDNAKDLINSLLTKPEHRLTLDQIKAHPFFDSIDWDHIFESTAPFLPAIKSLDDTSYFSIPFSELPPSPCQSQPLTPPSSPPYFLK
ncbi:kinase-like domain-containing protein [Absidia repens]|uniref:non-specific serine/threonine protein kinase n=1 Tax=Absidia repens TaxID=90262 RepID=A0A1X2J271_9FUNG|nr:kinase-like domain-containing protein [Absidia repens]